MAFVFTVLVSLLFFYWIGRTKLGFFTSCQHSPSCYPNCKWWEANISELDCSAFVIPNDIDCHILIRAGKEIDGHSHILIEHTRGNKNPGIAESLALHKCALFETIIWAIPVFRISNPLKILLEAYKFQGAFQNPKGYLNGFHSDWFLEFPPSNWEFGEFTL